MQCKVSIIVPVYNVERYIHECVDHLINQTYRDIEIILVDDSSPDGCPAICDAYAQSDSRVRVIHKPNGGLSDARNAGIEVATGAYLMFVDSDDYIVEDMVEQLVGMVEQTGAQIACCSYTGNEASLETGIREDIHLISAKKTLKYILTEKKLNTSASTKLYEARLFETVRFPVGKIYEDYATIYRVIHQSEKIAYVATPKYYYRPNPVSITGGSFYPKQLQYFEISDQVMGYVKAEYPAYKTYVNNRATRMAISFCKNISKSNFTDEEVIRFLIKYIRKHIFLYLFSGYATFSKLYGVWLSIAPRSALKFFKK